MSAILITGGSGFIGSHCILQRLAAGHQVRRARLAEGRRLKSLSVYGERTESVFSRLDNRN
jgi:nucleoside-diphosphate-sugar epimerase